jgi:hypothetical protein
LQLNGTQQCLTNADDVNILDGSISTIHTKSEAIVADGKENAENTKCYVDVLLAECRIILQHKDT